MAIRVDFQGRIDGRKRTPQGGLRVDANLTRTGIFVYHYDAGDGKGYREVREYRPASEVFKPESLETLKLAPVTIGHPDMVRADNYKDLAVGVVAENVRPREQFVASDLVIQDRKAVDAAESGELVEISCGYEVDVIATPGMTDSGERYDAIQTNIRYNHVALGGANWGRAGADVRLHLDSAGNSIVGNHYAGDMSNRQDDNDAKAHLDAITTATARADKAEAERDALRLELDAANARLTAVSAELDCVKTDTAKLIDPAKVSELVANRVALETGARAILGADAKFDNQSDSEIVAACLVKADPSLKVDGRSEDYLRARFDMAVESARRSDQAVSDLGKAITAPIVAQGKTEPSRLDKAAAVAAETVRKAATAGAPAGALTRK